jgi:photosystem II stability/assembly factor-like uncharacterized protein
MKRVMIIIAAMVFLSVVGCADDNGDGDNNGESLWSNLPSYGPYGWAVGLSDGDYGTILHTQDGGKTWVRQGDSTQLPNTGFSDVCVIDKNILLVSGDLQPNGNYSVLKSVNGGETWTLSGSGSLENATYNGMFALDKHHIWIVGEQGSIFYSTDVGDSWTKIEVPEEYREDIFLRVAAKSANDVWVVGDKHVDDIYPIMLHTTNGGANWERLNPIEDLNIETDEGHFLGIKTIGDTVWAIGGFGKFIIRSADNGATWNDITPSGASGDANDIFLLSETEAYVVEDYGGIFSTDDAGLHWTEHNADTNNWLLGIAILRGTDIWICGSPGGWNEYSVIKYSSDAGTTWEEQTPQLLKDNDLIGLYKIRFVESESRLLSQNRTTP